MHSTIKNLIEIENEIKLSLNNLKINNLPKIIAVSKTFKIDNILPLIKYGHLHFGENKVQEAIDKWTDIKTNNPQIKLHMIGKLQTNKVKYAVQLFDYIHSVDSEKLAKKIINEQKKIKKKVKIFIQVNIGNEFQKSGIRKDELNQLVFYCKNNNLNIIGLMCIPPADKEPAKYFKEIKLLNRKFNLAETSMGMSSDYLKAVENSSSYLRIGSSIFGERN
jgi:pyridoxal phosphate enzyme (YggS family)